MKKFLVPFCLFILVLFACKNNEKSKSGVAPEIDKVVENKSNSYSWSPRGREQKNLVFANADYVSSNFSTTSIEKSSAVSEKPMGQHERKLMKEGHVRFIADNLDDEHAKIEQLLERYNGYISSETSNTSEGTNEHKLVLRVPSVHFDVLFRGMGKDAVKMESKTIDVADVTEEHIDVSARIKTNIELENRFKDLLKKANKIDEILSIESEIASLRAQIESEQGRLNYLNDRVSLSTIYVSYHLKDSYIPEPEPGFGSKLGSSVGSGWSKILNFLLYLVGNWPVILLISVGAWYGRRYYRRYQANKPIIVEKKEA